MSFFFDKYINDFSYILFGLSSIWIASYGVIRFSAIFKSDSSISVETSFSKRLLPTLTVIALLTFANPHVYLDTMILIGSVSQQFPRDLRIWFGIGASLSSFVFFFSLGYGAQLLTPLMKKPLSWKILDGIISIIMFILAIKLAILAKWL